MTHSQSESLDTSPDSFGFDMAPEVIYTFLYMGSSSGKTRDISHIGKVFCTVRIGEEVEE